MKKLEEPLPCPFCGSECVAVDGSKIRPDGHGVRPYSYVKCESCGYNGIMTDDYVKSGIEDVVAAHNRVARAVMDAKNAKKDEAKIKPHLDRITEAWKKLDAVQKQFIDYLAMVSWDPCKTKMPPQAVKEGAKE